MIKWFKSLFKKQQPIEPPKYEQVIVLGEQHVVVRSRVNISPNLKMLDPNYRGTMIRNQISKDITDQIINSPQLVEWINTYDLGEEWVEARIKIIPNK
jgi:hypothetical protein